MNCTQEADKLRHNNRACSASSFSAGADRPSLTCQTSEHSLLNGGLDSLSLFPSRKEAAADDPLTAEDDCGNFFYTAPETGLPSSKKETVVAAFRWLTYQSDQRLQRHFSSTTEADRGADNNDHCSLPHHILVALLVALGTFNTAVDQFSPLAPLSSFATVTESRRWSSFWRPVQPFVHTASARTKC